MWRPRETTSKHSLRTLHPTGVHERAKNGTTNSFPHEPRSPTTTPFQPRYTGGRSVTVRAVGFHGRESERESTAEVLVLRRAAHARGARRQLSPGPSRVSCGI